MKNNHKKVKQKRQKYIETDSFFLVLTAVAVKASATKLWKKWLRKKLRKTQVLNVQHLYVSKTHTHTLSLTVLCIVWAVKSFYQHQDRIESLQSGFIRENCIYFIVFLMKRRQLKKTERKCYIFLEWIPSPSNFFQLMLPTPTPPHPTSSYWMIICQCRCHHFLQFFLSALVLLSRQNHISWGIQSTMAWIFFWSAK